MAAMVWIQIPFFTSRTKKYREILQHIQSDVAHICKTSAPVHKTRANLPKRAHIKIIRYKFVSALELREKGMNSSYVILVPTPPHVAVDPARRGSWPCQTWQLTPAGFEAVLTEESAWITIWATF